MDEFFRCLHAAIASPYSAVVCCSTFLEAPKQRRQALPEWKFVPVTSYARQATNLRSTRRTGTALATTQAKPF
jgi:hypothetical protein